MFINRRRELARMEQLARDAAAGAPVRHLALVGVRRIGKSVLIERYRSIHPETAVAEVRMDAAATTLPIFLRTMIRATLNALLSRRGEEEIGKSGSDALLLERAATIAPGLIAPVGEAFNASTQRRPDGQRLLELGLAFPEVAARVTDEPIVVMADEFQYLLGLAAYAPFGGRTPGQSRRADAEARESLLGVVRATIERPHHVGWIVTGSSVRVWQDLLGRGPLMGRFDVFPVQPFDEADTVALAEAVWDEVGVEHDPSAAGRVFRLSQGHPFYADVTCREAASTARRLQRRVGPDLVSAAFASAIHLPHGQIAIACREMYESLAARVAALRGFLDALAAEEPASVPEIAERMGFPSPSSAYRHAEELQWLGLVLETESGQYVFADPVFRYWIARAGDPSTRTPAAIDVAALRRLTRTYEEGYLRERALHGPLSEGYVRDLCRSFRGQHIDGARLGRPGLRAQLPMVDEVSSIEAMDPTGETLDRRGETVRVELDLCFGRDSPWLGEVKRTTDRVTAVDVRRLVRKAAFLRGAHGLPDGPVWFVSFSGFDRSAREAAAEHGVYLSGEGDLKALHALVGARRAERSPFRKPPA